MEIRCRKCECVHNTGCSCRAKAVKICKDTADCETYSKDDLKESIIIENGNIFQVAEGLVAENTRNVPLVCSATECLFNKKENCIANGILVADTPPVTRGEGYGACCATFCNS